MDTYNKKESYKIFDSLAPSYDFLNHLLSFGIDRYWRSYLAKKISQKNSFEVLDLATGTADLALTINKYHPKAKIIGIDMSVPMLQSGIQKVKKKGKELNIRLKKGNAAEIKFPDNSFDIVTIAFGIRNVPNVKNVLNEAYRVLKPGGEIHVLEFSLPKNKLLKKFYLFYFRKYLPFVGNLISGHKSAYTYLNKTVEDFPYGEEFNEYLLKSHFNKTSFHPLSWGIATHYKGQKGVL